MENDNYDYNMLEPPLRFTCDICDKVFRKVKTLKNHKSVSHEGLGVISCEPCNKFFTNPLSLKYHLESSIHTGFRYECKKCDKDFSRPHQLTRHVQYKHGKRGLDKWQCQVCHQSFMSLRGLRIHVDVHGGLGVRPEDDIHIPCTRKVVKQRARKVRPEGFRPVATTSTASDNQSPSRQGTRNKRVKVKWSDGEDAINILNQCFDAPKSSATGKAKPITVVETQAAASSSKRKFIGFTDAEISGSIKRMGRLSKGLKPSLQGRKSNLRKQRNQLPTPGDSGTPGTKVINNKKRGNNVNCPLTTYFINKLDKGTKRGRGRPRKSPEDDVCADVNVGKCASKRIEEVGGTELLSTEETHETKTRRLNDSPIEDSPHHRDMSPVPSSELVSSSEVNNLIYMADADVGGIQYEDDPVVSAASKWDFEVNNFGSQGDNSSDEEPAGQLVGENILDDVPMRDYISESDEPLAVDDTPGGTRVAAESDKVAPKPGPKKVKEIDMFKSIRDEEKLAELKREKVVKSTKDVVSDKSKLIKKVNSLVPIPAKEILIAEPKPVKDAETLSSSLPIIVKPTDIEDIAGNNAVEVEGIPNDKPNIEMGGGEDVNNTKHVNKMGNDKIMDNKDVAGTGYKQMEGTKKVKKEIRCKSFDNKKKSPDSKPINIKKTSDKPMPVDKKKKESTEFSKKTVDKPKKVKKTNNNKPQNAKKIKDNKKIDVKDSDHRIAIGGAVNTDIKTKPSNADHVARQNRITDTLKRRLSAVIDDAGPKRKKPEVKSAPSRKAEDRLGVIEPDSEEEESSTDPEDEDAESTTPKKSLSCESCAVSFSGQASLNRHMESVHQGIRYRCSKCGKSYARRINAMEHMKMAHPAPGHQHMCEFCGNVFLNDAFLARHMQLSHICATCGKCLKSDITLRRHIASAHQDNKFPCQHCNKVFTKSRNRIKHVRESHPTTLKKLRS